MAPLFKGAIYHKGNMMDQEIKETTEMNQEIKEVTELDLLKEKADTMGISYHPSIGVEKLKEKIAAKTESITPKKNEKETIAQRNARLRKEANKLVRVRITCMNPMKKNWPGEIYSVANKAIGSIKKFIPFNAEEGFHVPQVILGILKEKMYQSFYVVNVKGRKVKRSKLVKEFAIEELPDLTIEELQELATKQAMAQSADK